MKTRIAARRRRASFFDARKEDNNDFDITRRTRRITRRKDEYNYGDPEYQLIQTRIKEILSNG